MVAFCEGGDGDCAEEDVYEAAGAGVGELLLEDGEADAELVAEAGDAAETGVESGIGAGFGGEGVMVPVVLADEASVLAVAVGAAVGLDPAIFVWWDGLLGELAADPVGLFGKDDCVAERGGGEGGGDTAGAAADDEDVCGAFGPFFLVDQ